MSHFQYPHPWDPGFATPAYVLAEPQGRGTFTTKYTPRGTIGTVPKNRMVYNRTRWATPNYAQGRYGENPLITKMIPRRTVSLLAPDFFARPLAGGVLAGSSLGDDFAVGSQGDPIRAFGEQGAQQVISKVKRLPRAQRAQGLRDALGPTLNAEVEKKMSALRAKGVPPKEALRRALAASLSNRLGEEFVRLGKTAAPASATALSGGYSAVGATVTIKKVTTEPQTFGVTGGGWNELKKQIHSTVVSKFDKKIYDLKKASGGTLGGVAGTMASYYMTGRYPIVRVSNPPGFGVYLKFDKSWGYQLGDVKSVTVVAKKIPPTEGFLDSMADFVGDIVTVAVEVIDVVTDKLKPLVCGVASHPAGQIAAGAAGGPAGAAGAQIVAGMCPQNYPPISTAPASSGFPILPLAIAAGGALLLVLVLK